MQRIPVSSRMVTIIGIVFFILISGCSTQPTNSGDLSINQSCGARYSILASEPVEIHYGEWGALGSDLAEENGQHITVRLQIDDQEVLGAREPVMACSSFVDHFCRVGAGYCSDGSFWLISKATIGPLDPGEHEVIVTYILDEEITDGYDSNRDGETDMFGPGEWGQRRYTIVAK